MKIAIIVVIISMLVSASKASFFKKIFYIEDGSDGYCKYRLKRRVFSPFRKIVGYMLWPTVMSETKSDGWWYTDYIPPSQAVEDGGGLTLFYLAFAIPLTILPVFTGSIVIIRVIFNKSLQLLLKIL